MDHSKTIKDLIHRCEDCISSALGSALTFFEKVRFDKNNGQHLSAICLFARIVELSGSCKALLEKEALTGLPILVRSMFEADIDLINCIKDINYFKIMYASFLKEKLKLTKETLSEKDNPYLKPIAEFRNFRKDLEFTQVELDSLKSQGYIPLRIKDRANNAGKLNEYLSLYDLLCLDSHNNIGSLEKYHIVQAGNQRDYQVAVFNINKEDLMSSISAIPGILFHRTKDLIDFFQLEDLDIEEAYKKFEELQESLEKYARSQLSNKHIDS